MLTWRPEIGFIDSCCTSHQPTIYLSRGSFAHKSSHRIQTYIVHNPYHGDRLQTRNIFTKVVLRRHTYVPESDLAHTSSQRNYHHHASLNNPLHRLCDAHISPAHDDPRRPCRRTCSKTHTRHVHSKRSTHAEHHSVLRPFSLPPSCIRKIRRALRRILPFPFVQQDAISAAVSGAVLRVRHEHRVQGRILGGKRSRACGVLWECGRAVGDGVCVLYTGFDG